MDKITIQDTGDCFKAPKLTSHEFKYVIKYATYNKEKELFFFKKDVGAQLINDVWVKNNSKDILISYFKRRGLL